MATDGWPMAVLFPRRWIQCLHGLSLTLMLLTHHVGQLRTPPFRCVGIDTEGCISNPRRPRDEKKQPQHPTASIVRYDLMRRRLFNACRQCKPRNLPSRRCESGCRLHVASVFPVECSFAPDCWKELARCNFCRIRSFVLTALQMLFEQYLYRFGAACVSG